MPPLLTKLNAIRLVYFELIRGSIGRETRQILLHKGVGILNTIVEKMASVAALNSMQKAAMNSSIDGNVRRRDRPPPTAPYTTYYGTHPSSEEDILLGGGSYGIEEGLYMQRQRRKSVSPWYKQPQKMILIATLCFVGSVLYLANLAHTIIQTNNQLHSMKNTNNKMKSARNLYGASSSSGSTSSSSSITSGKASDEHIREWLETHNYGNKYGATANTGGEANNNEDFQQWLHNKYRASSVYSSDYKKSGISSSSSSSSTSSELGDAYNDYLEYLQSEGKMGNVQDQSNLGASVGGGADAVYKEWLEYNNNGGQHTKYNPSNGQYTQTATPRTMSEALTKIQQLESELKATKAQLRQGSGQ